MVERQSPPSADGPSATPTANAAKVALRDQLLTSRHRRSLLDVGTAGRAIAEHVLATTEVRRAATVAAYVSIGAEPARSALLDGLVGPRQARRTAVVLPGLDLDWAVYPGPTALAPARRGLLEPVGPRLGLDAVATADLVLVPGLAVSPRAADGPGGGRYDRALGRVPVGTPVWVLLYDDEVGLTSPPSPTTAPSPGL